MELKISYFERALIVKGLQMLLNDKEKLKKEVSFRLNENNLSNVKEAYNSILNDTLLTLLDIETLIEKINNI